MDDINVIVANIATIIVFSVTVYATIFRKVYDKHKILLLWAMSLTIFSWGRIPLWINDIMYDLLFVVLAIGLVHLRKEKKEELKIYMAKQHNDRVAIIKQLKERIACCRPNSSTTNRH